MTRCRRRWYVGLEKAIAKLTTMPRCVLGTVVAREHDDGVVHDTQLVRREAAEKPDEAA